LVSAVGNADNGAGFDKQSVDATNKAMSTLLWRRTA
jgi:hypothetical protein